MLLGGSSAQHRYVGQFVQLNVIPTCNSGFFINISNAISRNSSAMYDFLVSVTESTRLCSRCEPGTISTSDTMSFCSNCSGGTFETSNNTECLRCPVGMWSRAGAHGTCRACSSNATTTERDHCVTLQFLNPPPFSVVSGASNRIPAVALVDLFDSTIVPRSGPVFVHLQCRLPECQTDSNSEFDLIASSLNIVNGSSVTTEVFFSESSLFKIGTGFVWRIFTTQEALSLAHSKIDSQQSSYRILFLGGAPSIGAVFPTQVASNGGTEVRVLSNWNLHPRILSVFANDSAFCVFSFIDSIISSNGSNTTSIKVSRQERVAAIATFQESAKTCRTPAVPDFSYANLTIVTQDGRLSTNSILLQSVCHNNYYVNASKCQLCPVSLSGQSSNALINAPAVESCVCSAGSYGTFGEFCRFCPTPSSLPSPPFMCNSSNLRYPVVAPGYWVDYSLLSRCDKLSATCPAVTTCAFGARACPGGGEKVCTQRDDECYQGTGCTNCCPAYYNELNACFKCPDSSQTTALLAVVAVCCFVLAVLMSSVSSPSFTQSSKKELMCESVFR